RAYPAALRRDRVPLLGWRRAAPEPPALRRRRPDARARRAPADHRAPGADRRARAGQERLPDRDDTELFLSVRRFEETSTPAPGRRGAGAPPAAPPGGRAGEHGRRLPVGVGATAARHFAETLAERFTAGRPGWTALLAPTLPLGSFTFDAVGTVTVRQRVVR